jgi:hypothetical protein
MMKATAFPDATNSRAIFWMSHLLSLDHCRYRLGEERKLSRNIMPAIDRRGKALLNGKGVPLLEAFSMLRMMLTAHHQVINDVHTGV